MALRLAEGDQRQIDDARLQAMRGIGAFKLVRAKELPLAKEYVGRAALMELALTAIPGLAGPIEFAITNGIGVPKDSILRYEIRQDSDPTFDKYNARVWVAGDFDIPPNGLQGEGVGREVMEPPIVMVADGIGAIGFLPVLLLLKIVLAVGLLSIFGAVAWKITKTDWGETVAKNVVLPLVIVGGAALAGLFILKRSESRG